MFSCQTAMNIMTQYFQLRLEISNASDEKQGVLFIAGKTGSSTGREPFLCSSPIEPSDAQEVLKR